MFTFRVWKLKGFYITPPKIAFKILQNKIQKNLGPSGAIEYGKILFNTVTISTVKACS